MPTIFLGADHAGRTLKNAIADSLRLRDMIVEDLGAYQNDPDDDYPEYAARVAHAAQNHPGSMGILVCGSAEGMCMAANKFSGIRAGVGFSQEAVQAMRNDDDANILCIPTRITTDDDPFVLVETFLTTPFSEAERHKRRIGQMDELGT